MPSSNGVFVTPLMAAEGIHETLVTADSNRTRPTLRAAKDPIRGSSTALTWFPVGSSTGAALWALLRFAEATSENLQFRTSPKSESKEPDMESQTTPARRPKRLRVGAIVCAAAVGAAIGGAALAGAATGGSGGSGTSGTAGAAATAPSNAPDPAKMAQGPGETLLTGTTAEKVKAAALAAVPGATIIRVETDNEGSPYEAHMTKADGTQVTVKVDANFKVTATEDGFGGGPGRGPGGGRHGGPGGPDDAPASASAPSGSGTSA